MSPGFDLRIFALNFSSVAFGEFIACVVIGLPLVRYLRQSGLGSRIFSSIA